MRFPEPLIHGRLIRRYQRFLADVELDDGTIVTAHCTNTGSMKTCSQPGWRVALSPAHNPGRKLPYTWELVHNGACWIGINTHLANRIAEEAVRNGWIPQLAGYLDVLREKPYGNSSRIDLLLRGTSADSTQETVLGRHGDLGRQEAACGDAAPPQPSLIRRPDCYVEVKNVSLLETDGSVSFPDAVTLRGRKHLGELRNMASQGFRAVMLFVVQRPDGAFFRPAWKIDPEYGRALIEAVENGVEALACRADVSPEGIDLHHPMPIDLSMPG